MPIDMESAVNSQVLIQLKTKTYIVGKFHGQLMPAMMKQDPSDPTSDDIVIAADYLLGKLSKLGEQYAVTYVTPDRTKMRVLLDMDNVMAVFYEDTSVIDVVASTAGVSAPIAG